MWFVHYTLPLSLNYGSLICFLALLPRSFVLVRCLWEANVATFCRRFSWRRQTSLSKGFFYYFRDSTTELYFRSTTCQCRCCSKITKTTKENLIHVIHGKLKDNRSCFITRWRVFYKCVQLVQGEIILISITIILPFILKKTSHTSFCFFDISKLVSPQYLLFTLFCFREKNGEKTIQLTSINLFTCGCRICDALRESSWRVAPEKQSLKQHNASVSKYINLIFCHVM